ncbi:MAG: SEC-C domain-containing protein [Planctomycetia bacterium]|nr:SEC-C domain-containing protein [Planctomycetia bacterium]
MGAIADAIVAYAQPLLDETDGSEHQMQTACTISQLCWNLALLPAERRDQSLREMQPSLNMDDAEFESFRCTVVIPMIRRHEQMFPHLHGGFSADTWQNDDSPPTHSGTAKQTEKYPGTDRYAPCPCNSGRKYKFCCGKKAR